MNLKNIRKNCASKDKDKNSYFAVTDFLLVWFFQYRGAESEKPNPVNKGVIKG